MTPPGEQRLARRLVAGGVSGSEVDSAVAVHLQVDEAGCGDAAALLRWEADGEDASVHDLDVAAEQVAVDDRGLDAQPHGAASRGTPNVGPPSAATAWRTASGTPASSSVLSSTRRLRGRRLDPR